MAVQQALRVNAGFPRDQKFSLKTPLTPLAAYLREAILHS